MRLRCSDEPRFFPAFETEVVASYLITSNFAWRNVTAEEDFGKVDGYKMQLNCSR